MKPAREAVSSFDLIVLEQNTPEWHWWRNQGIGASDAPCVMGEDPWKSVEALRREKLHPKPGGIGTAAMRRGLALEPAARTSYSATRGTVVQSACVQNRRRPWMRASLDGLNAREERVVEIKCGTSCYRRTAAGRTVPRGYYGQLQHILAVLDYSSIDFWCYSPGRRPLLVEIGRDENYIARLIAREQEFWDVLGSTASAGA